MPCIKSLLLAFLRFTTNLLPFAGNQEDSRSLNLPSLSEVEIEFEIKGNFKEILSNTPPEQVRSVLAKHLPSQYKVGIFEKDHAAIEAIHQTNPTMATKLLAAARYDLIRRQNGNLTSPTTTTTTPTVIVTLPVTTTNSAGSQVTSAVTAIGTPTASIVVTGAATNAAGQTIITSSTVPAVVLTNNGQITTAPAATVDGSGDVVQTMTNDQGSVFVTTYTPMGGVFTSFAVFTSTLANGQLSTFTSYAAVTHVTASPSASTTPKLQGAATTIQPNVVTVQGVLLLALVFGFLMI